MKKYLTKLMSVFLAALMVFSCFVFAPDMFTKAEAVNNAGTYTVKVTTYYGTQNGFNGGKITPTLIYKKYNGTDSSTSTVACSQISVGPFTNTSKTEIFTTGFPVGVQYVAQSDDATSIPTLQWGVKIEVNETTVYDTGGWKLSHENINASTYTNFNTCVPTDKYPYVNSFTWGDASTSSIEVPFDTANKTASRTVTAYDQYGVQTKSDIYFTLLDANNNKLEDSSYGSVARTADSNSDKATVTIKNEAKKYVLGSDSSCKRNVKVKAWTYKKPNALTGDTVSMDSSKYWEIELENYRVNYIYTFPYLKVNRRTASANPTSVNDDKIYETAYKIDGSAPPNNMSISDGNLTRTVSQYWGLVPAIPNVTNTIGYNTADNANTPLLDESEKGYVFSGFLDISNNALNTSTFYKPGISVKQINYHGTWTAQDTYTNLVFYTADGQRITDEASKITIHAGEKQYSVGQDGSGNTTYTLMVDEDTGNFIPSTGYEVYDTNTYYDTAVINRVPAVPTYPGTVEEQNKHVFTGWVCTASPDSSEIGEVIAYNNGSYVTTSGFLAKHPYFNFTMMNKTYKFKATYRLKTSSEYGGDIVNTYLPTFYNFNNTTTGLTNMATGVVYWHSVDIIDDIPVAPTAANNAPNYGFDLADNDYFFCGWTTKPTQGSGVNKTWGTDEDVEYTSDGTNGYPNSFRIKKDTNLYPCYRAEVKKCIVQRSYYYLNNNAPELYNETAVQDSSTLIHSMYLLGRPGMTVFNYQGYTYTFTGWSTTNYSLGTGSADANYPSETKMELTTDIHVYAVYSKTPIEYKAYYENGNTRYYTTGQLTHGATYQIANDYAVAVAQNGIPTKDRDGQKGYIFNGLWGKTSTSTLGETQYTVNDSTINQFYALYDSYDYYTVTFKDETGKQLFTSSDFLSGDTITYTEDESLDSEFNYARDSADTTHDRKDAQGNATSITAYIPVLKDKTTTSVAKSFNFIGWKASTDSSDAEYTIEKGANITVTGNVTYTAVYKEQPRNYDIRFYDIGANKQTDAPILTLNLQYGSNIYDALQAYYKDVNNNKLQTAEGVPVALTQYANIRALGMTQMTKDNTVSDIKQKVTTLPDISPVAKWEDGAVKVVEIAGEKYTECEFTVGEEVRTVYYKSGRYYTLAGGVTTEVTADYIPTVVPERVIDTNSPMTQTLDDGYTYTKYTLKRGEKESVIWKNKNAFYTITAGKATVFVLQEGDEYEIVGGEMIKQFNGLTYEVYEYKLSSRNEINGVVSSKTYTIYKYNGEWYKLGYFSIPADNDWYLYSFNGWTPVLSASELVSGEADYVATYKTTAVTHNVYWLVPKTGDLNGDTNYTNYVQHKNSPVEYTYQRLVSKPTKNPTVSEPADKPEGDYAWVFKGWKLATKDNTGILTIGDYFDGKKRVGTEDIYYVADFGWEENTHTVEIYDFNTTTLLYKDIHLMGDEVTLPTPEKSNDDTYHYTLSGFTDVSGGSVVKYTETYTVGATDIKLYAVYSAESHDTLGEPKVITPASYASNGLSKYTCSVCGRVGAEIQSSDSENYQSQFVDKGDPSAKLSIGQYTWDKDSEHNGESFIQTDALVSVLAVDYGKELGEGSYAKNEGVGLKSITVQWYDKDGATVGEPTIYNYEKYAVTYKNESASLPASFENGMYVTVTVEDYNGKNVSITSDKLMIDTTAPTVEVTGQCFNFDLTVSDNNAISKIEVVSTSEISVKPVAVLEEITEDIPEEVKPYIVSEGNIMITDTIYELVKASIPSGEFEGDYSALKKDGKYYSFNGKLSFGAEDTEEPLFIAPGKYKITIEDKAGNVTTTYYTIKTEHNYTNEKEIKATCTEDGSKSKVCVDCGFRPEPEVISALGHSDSIKTKHSKVVATCTQDGSKEYYYCDKCEKYFIDSEGSEEILKSDIVIKAQGHSWVEDTLNNVAPNCTDKGIRKFKCENCEATKQEDIPALGHSWGEYAYASDADKPTCSKSGKMVRECTREGCDETQEKIIAKTGEHDYKPVEGTEGVCVDADGKCYVKFKCETCDLYFWANQDLKEHNYVTYTGPIYKTDEGKYVIPETDEEKAKSVEYPKEATCTEDAVYASQCTVCGDFKFVTEKFTNLGGHTLVKVSANEATCSLEGNNKYWKCSVCEKLFSDVNGKTETTQEAVKLEKNDNHSIIKVEAAEPTCVAKGNVEYYKCIWCDNYFEDALGETKYEDKADVEIEIDEDAHDFSVFVAEESELASCIVKGKNVYKCSREGCEEKFEEELDMIPHNLEKVAETPATCTSKGYIEHYECDKCSKFFLDAEGTVEKTLADLETSIDPTNHNLTKVDALEATCTTQGNLEYYECIRCTKLFADENGETEYVNGIADVTTEINADNHDFSILLTAECEESTCTVNGKNVYKCSRCSETDTVTLDLLPHTLEKAEKIDATCVEVGYEEHYKCSECEKLFSDEEGSVEVELSDLEIAIDLTNHDFSELGEETTATCTEPGKIVYKCNREGCEATKEEEKLVALGHNFTVKLTKDDDERVVSATCTEAGVDVFKCSRCDETKVEAVSALGHKTARVKAVYATCVDEGTEAYYKCTNDGCDKIFKDSKATIETTLEDITTPVDTNNHDYVLVPEEYIEATCTEAGKNYYKCQREGCDKTKTENVALPLNHTLTKVYTVAATCVEKGTSEHYECSVCHNLYKDSRGKVKTTAEELEIAIDANNHDYILVPEKYIEATCTEAGKNVYECQRDGCEAAKTVNVLAPLGHNYILNEEETVLPTCSTNGTNAYYCDRTDCTATKYEIVLADKKYHNWNAETDTVVEVSEATCTKEGLKKWSATDGCAAEKDVVIDKIAHDMEIGLVTKEATCGRPGSKCDKCKVCGYIENTEQIVATGEHDFELIKTLVAPTCTEKGDGLYNCRNCGAVETKTDEISAAGHKLIKVPAKEATCTEQGREEYYKCTVCYGNFNEDEEPVDPETLLTDLGDHSLIKIIAKAATCVDDGNIEYYKCTICKKLFEDENGENEIVNVNDITVSKTGVHNYVGEPIIVNPSCTDDGYSYKKCTVCNYEDKVINEGSALGHTNINKDGNKIKPIRVNKELTCKQDGVYVYNCTRCGSSYEETVESQGTEHNYTAYGDGVQTKAPTCTENGEMTYTRTCIYCSAPNEKKISISNYGGHKYDYTAPDSKAEVATGEDELTTTYKYKCKNPGCTVEDTKVVVSTTSTIMVTVGEDMNLKKVPKDSWLRATDLEAYVPELKADNGDGTYEVLIWMTPKLDENGDEIIENSNVVLEEMTFPYKVTRKSLKVVADIRTEDSVYTVKFLDKDGKVITKASITDSTTIPTSYTYNQEAVVPDYSVANYRLLGWKDQNNVTYDAGAKITVTGNAEFRPILESNSNYKTFVIDYKNESGMTKIHNSGSVTLYIGGEDSDSVYKVYTVENYVEKISPDSVLHYNFLGWALEDGTVVTSITFTKNSKSVVLKPKFEKVKHTQDPTVQVIKTAATCTAAATEKHTCICGYTWTTTTDKATGHKNIETNRVVSEEQTIIYYECSVCHDKSQRTVSNTNNYIGVKVTDGTDMIAGATVVVMTDSIQGVSAKTDEKGVAKFQSKQADETNGLADGIYNVKVTKDGYQAATGKLIVSDGTGVITVTMVKTQCHCICHGSGFFRTMKLFFSKIMKIFNSNYKCCDCGHCEEQY